MSTVVFFGTPQAAVPSLETLADSHEVTAVITRPDKPAGRKRKLQAPAAKDAALGLGIPVHQPTSRVELIETVASIPSPDVGIVVAFGMILPPAVLEWPRRGFLNLHFSRLPRWRGAAPVERAIMAGDTETAATVMVMDEGLDTGPVLAEHVIEIGALDTGGTVTDRLADLGARLLDDNVSTWVDGTTVAQAQPDHGATYADRILSADRLVGPSLSAREFVDRVRALAPSPGAQMTVDGQPHKLLEVVQSDITLSPGEWSSDNDVPVVGVADAGVQIQLIQPPGKKPMTGADWLRGRRQLPQKDI